MRSYNFTITMVPKVKGYVVAKTKEQAIKAIKSINYDEDFSEPVSNFNIINYDKQDDK